MALVVFRRTEDEERAFIAFHNDGRGLFGAPVHAEFCVGNGMYSKMNADVWFNLFFWSRRQTLLTVSITSISSRYSYSWLIESILSG